MYHSKLPEGGAARPAVCRTDGVECDSILDLAPICRFTHRCRGSASLDELTNLAGELAIHAGFRWFAVGDCTDAGRGRQVPLLLANLPDELARKYIELGIFWDDAFIQAVQRSSLPLIWDHIRITLAEQGSKSRLLEALEQHGLVHGVTLPIHLPGEHVGVATFISDVAPINLSSLVTVELLGPEMLVRARHIRQGSSLQALERKPMLTPRQRDCLVLIAQGKSDWEAGKILGLSAQTIHGHIEAVRSRYGVRRRTQLVLRALYTGEISFEEIL
ncbi:helix-turn-helix transcriptional regulator [Sphingobium indicum]